MRLLQLARAGVRCTRFVLHLGLGLVLASTYRLFRGADWYLSQGGQAIIHWWMRRGTRIVGIRITQYGQPLQSHALLVCNHISFLDIVTISSVLPVRFLSKHSVRYWPLIGYLSAVSGSLFIERGKRRQLQRSLEALRQALGFARPVLVFPEGTTSIGNEVLPFHSGLFQAAIDNQVPVQALTLHYRHNEQADRLAAYIDNDNFLLNLLRLMARAKTEVHLSFTPPIDSHGHTRRSLAAYCHARISQNLAYQLHHDSDPSEADTATPFAILGVGECEP